MRTLSIESSAYLSLTLVEGDYPTVSPSVRRHNLVFMTPPPFQEILVKLSSYCSYDLKMIIFYRGHARLMFTRVMAL